MNKLIVQAGVALMLLCAGKWAFAAQQTLTDVPSLKTGNAISTLGTNVQGNIDKQGEMNTELYTGKSDSSCFASAEAFNACFALDWPLGDNLGSASATDVASLFSGDGTYLKKDGTTGTPTGTTYTEGTGIDITDNVISATGGADMSWPAAAGIMVYGGSNAYGDSLSLVTTVGATGTDTAVPTEKGVREAVNALPIIVFGTGLSITENSPSAGTDTITVTPDTYHPYTSALASMSGENKYWGTDSSGEPGVYDLPTTSTGTGGYVSLSSAPYSDTACTSGQYSYVGDTAYLCAGGYWSKTWTLASYTNATPVVSCDGSGTFLRSGSVSGDTESFERGTGLFCSSDLTLSGSTGINTYSTSWYHLGEHSLAISDDSSATADHITANHGSAQVTNYYRMYLNTESLGSSGATFSFFGVGKYNTSAQVASLIRQTDVGGTHRLEFAGQTTDGFVITPGAKYRVEYGISDTDGSGAGVSTATMRVYDSGGAQLTSALGLSEITKTSVYDSYQYVFIWPASSTVSSKTMYVDAFKNCADWCGGEI